ncbi:MAG TPA: hypothetical protein VL354_19780 [Spirochaetia bacterium]|nr:hypothetical protein [Spirochaetia bacterium]
MSEKIGEFLIRIGAMTQDQVSRVLRLQAAGDRRRFGTIAEELRFITSYDRIRDFLSALKK